MLGVLTMDQAVPFQCSARVCALAFGPPGPMLPSPTAQQSEALMQVTALRTLVSVGLVLGVVTIDQVNPLAACRQGSATIAPSPYSTSQGVPQHYPIG